MYVEADLAPAAVVGLTTQQSHQVLHVLRLGLGAKVRVFNGVDGEYDARLQSVGKSSVHLEVLEQTRPQAGVPDLHLVFAALKKGPMDLVVEKAVEMGVATLRPVLTERTVAREVRTDRLKRIAIEAAEQTERLEVPEIHEAASLTRALADLGPDCRVFFADESGDDGAKPWGGESGRARPMAEAARIESSGPAAILIGPEGGFSPMERAWLRTLPNVRPVGLGPRILRAETAAIAALALYQALAGDWRG